MYANLLIDSPEPRVEESWLGQTLQIGVGNTAVRLRPSQRDKRCMMIGFDPDTANYDSRLLQTVTRGLDACAGVYADVAQPGQLRVGDILYGC